MSDIKQVTVGSYLGQRLVEAGLKDFFTVPGDFTLVLLDQLLATPGLRMISCCN
jgi:TPP-dependent 2-oxoacid decarboxylase